MNFDKEVDAAGLACPMPIVKTKKALASMASGQVLRVVATDPGSVADMAAFAEQTGNPLLHSGTEGERFVYFLRRA
ncbi:MAG: sulfurtransferase TusA family protein [Burkholderiales bacterium]|nr:sulfurtransferase TusA family protein [Burkholderiales bacterium]